MAWFPTHFGNSANGNPTPRYSCTQMPLWNKSKPFGLAA